MKGGSRRCCGNQSQVIVKAAHLSYHRHRFDRLFHEQRANKHHRKFFRVYNCVYLCGQFTDEIWLSAVEAKVSTEEPRYIGLKRLPEYIKIVWLILHVLHAQCPPAISLLSYRCCSEMVGGNTVHHTNLGRFFMAGCSTYARSSSSWMIRLVIFFFVGATWNSSLAETFPWSISIRAQIRREKPKRYEKLRFLKHIPEFSQPNHDACLISQVLPQFFKVVAKCASLWNSTCFSFSQTPLQLSSWSSSRSSFQPRFLAVYIGTSITHTCCKDYKFPIHPSPAASCSFLLLQW